MRHEMCGNLVYRPVEAALRRPLHETSPPMSLLPPDIPYSLFNSETEECAQGGEMSFYRITEFISWKLRQQLLGIRIMKLKDCIVFLRLLPLMRLRCIANTCS